MNPKHGLRAPLTFCSKIEAKKRERYGETKEVVNEEQLSRGERAGVVRRRVETRWEGGEGSNCREHRRGDR